ncbi:hypothetical protein, variant 1 [Blastomyces dermatitidis ER-3]|uniref:Uncharacterized protein n=1 Tax=Ajellomyces dermatitidis (strain ER-3 / ATCC MYA-2586) TaxID=559297 RepID=A0ABX2VSK8_AJEDR|nr:hypothetical protein, variant 1 [Blastomyces dermatitidis ER-3]OAS99805.1 hypothetical protein, variant 1 [Blastomyces dermatitidis ER-3]
MPIKLPKGFARRKSSGNALEALDETPQPSFRVFERPGAARKSLDGSTTLNSSTSNSSHNKRLSEDPYANNIFANIDHPSPVDNRGSRGTNNSASTGRLYDSSASSAKFSSSSTLPSSTDIPIQDVPPPPVHDSSFFSFRSAGRTFSFGTKSSSSKSLQRLEATTPRSRGTATARERAPTTSTTSTATPHRLPDTELDMGDSLSFGNMFDGFDKEKEVQKEPLSPSPLGRGSASALPPLPTNDTQNHPTPLRIVPSKDVEPSPRTNESQNSRDGLMSREDDDIISRPPASRVRTSVQPNTNGSLSPTYNTGSTSRFYRNTVQLDRNAAVEDEDAKIVKNAVSAHRRMTAEFSPDGDFPDPLPFSENRLQQRNNVKQITRRPVLQDEESHLAAALAAEASLAERYEENANNSERQLPTKVMTPAQFERYRQQKEMTRKNSNASDTHHSDDDSDHYDEEEEDEVEKAREAAKQRKKQEAHLSVYRQQMMKVTGETIKPLDSDQNGVDKARAASLNNLNRSSFLAPEPTTNGKVSDGEDDDDIPLAILAAHGFPNKTRPPGHLTPSISNPNLRASMLSFAQGPPSVAAEPTAGTQTGRTSLPVFARNLPRDPYNIGAGLVNPSHRESLAMGGGTPSVYGAPPGFPPGGLVGVIANEERAKAMRRGSPNAVRPYDAPPGSLLGMNLNGQHNNTMPLPQQQQFLNVPGAPPGQPPGFGQPDQMSQMTQMMQTQIQWMQSMMQMQGMQMPLNMGLGSHNSTPPNGPSMARPISMLSNLNFNQPQPQGPPQVDHRTLSLLDPKWNNRQSSFLPQQHPHLGPGPGPGYTPSVAPSERSNVGTASRYRPVSTMQQPPQDNAMARSSTFTASTLRPWADAESRKMSLTSNIGGNGMGMQQPYHLPRVATEGSNVVGGLRPVSGLRASTNASVNGGQGGKDEDHHDDDDDEEEEAAWAEMMKNREKKKSGWRFKKTGSSGLGLGDLFPGSGPNSP